MSEEELLNAEYLLTSMWYWVSRPYSSRSQAFFLVLVASAGEASKFNAEFGLLKESSLGIQSMHPENREYQGILRKDTRVVG